MYFPLHPDTPAEGLSLKDLFAGRGLDLDAMHARMKGLMDIEHLPYNRRTHTYNSRLAQELAKWADSKPGFDKIHDALYKAYFVEGRNLANKDVLLEIAQSLGLPVEETRPVLDNRTFKDAVDADCRRHAAMASLVSPLLSQADQKSSALNRTKCLPNRFGPQARIQNMLRAIHSEEGLFPCACLWTRSVARTAHSMFRRSFNASNMRKMSIPFAAARSTKLSTTSSA